MSQTATSKPTVTPARAERRPRPTRIGVAKTSKRDKTIKVSIGFNITHPKYGKIIRRQTVLQAHDEKNEARNGDVVEIVECRKISRTKSWRLVRIVEKAPRTAEVRG